MGFTLFRYIFIGICILIFLFFVTELLNLNEPNMPAPPNREVEKVLSSRFGSKLSKFFANICTEIYWIVGLSVIVGSCYLYVKKKLDTSAKVPSNPPTSISQDVSTQITTHRVSMNTQESPLTESLITTPRLIEAPQEPLQAIEAPQLDQPSPFSSLVGIFTRLENDSECTDEKKIQIKDLLKMYSSERRKIGQFHKKQLSELKNQTEVSLKKLHSGLFDIKNPGTSTQSTSNNMTDINSFDD